MSPLAQWHEPDTQSSQICDLARPKNKTQITRLYEAASQGVWANFCRPQDVRKAKYELTTTLRTHLGYQDDAFGCMGVAEDADGVQGVFLKKNVIQVAGRSLKMNISTLAPRVLPVMELVNTSPHSLIHTSILVSTLQ